MYSLGDLASCGMVNENKEVSIFSEIVNILELKKSPFFTKHVLKALTGMRIIETGLDPKIHEQKVLLIQRMTYEFQ